MDVLDNLLGGAASLAVVLIVTRLSVVNVMFLCILLVFIFEFYQVVSGNVVLLF